MLVSATVLRTYDSSARTIFDVGFGFGSAMQGLVMQHRMGYPDPFFGYWAYALRMPAIPVFGALVSLLSRSFAVFYTIKNVVCWGLWIYALLRIRRHFGIADRWIWLAASLVILLPYNGNIISRVEVEEAYLVALLCLAFALLLTVAGWVDYLGLALLVGILYLTKSSMPLLCGVIVAWAACTGWKRYRFAALLPALGLALAVVGWGAYIYANTGVVAFGVHESSMNGLNFVKSNNSYALALYPRVTLDVLDLSALGMYPKKDDEWSLSNAQLAMGVRFDHEHPDMVLRMDRKKLWVACCDLFESPEKIPGKIRPLVVVSNLVDHLSMAVSLLWMGLRLRRRRLVSAEVLFLLLNAAYLTPYLGGFLYMRHMVPLYSLAAMVLAIQSAPTEDSAVGLARAASSVPVDLVAAAIDVDGSPAIEAGRTTRVPARSSLRSEA